ncbi:hypothetical protein DBY65_002665 [Pseudomonas sp. RIT412]|nr:hypothetical protein DBP26_012830 [Pseudomonas sp. RIT 409]RAU56049.1 hypothetical protein DBY65_002665 [Pseudomonas sp. RIT 412]
MPTVIVLSLIWLISSWANLTVLVWFTYKNIDILESHLSDCAGVTATRNLWQGGVIGRQMRLSIIFAIMYMPKVMHRRGDITRDAHLNIPQHLRRRIWTIHIWLLINGFFLAALCYAIGGTQ